MKIVHFLHRIWLADGGVVRGVIDLVSALAEAGTEVVLLTRDGLDAPREWLDGGPRVVVLPGPSRPAGLLPRVARAAAGEHIADADALHLHSAWDPANLGLAAQARHAGVPYFVSAHGQLDDWSMSRGSPKKRLYLAFAARRLLERAARVHCTAEAELAQASKWFPRGQGTIVPLIVDLGPFRELPGAEEALDRLGLAADRPLILFLSRIHEKKGVDVLLRAFAALREHFSGAVLVVAGPGEPAYVESMRRLATNLGVADDTHFPGMVSGALKASLYQAAWVFALPTSQENFGLVLPESLACRTPVVSTDGVDLWRELEDSGGAVICDRNPAAFAEALGELIKNPASRRRMGEAGRTWVLNELDGERLVARYLAMYTQEGGPR